MSVRRVSRLGQIIFFSLSVTLTACNISVAQPTELALATSAPTLTQTASPTATASAIPTLTHTATSSSTPTSTATDTPTPTDTPTVTKTPQPLPTFTPSPLPSDTPNPRPVAPLYADTPIQPFSPDAFLAALYKTHQSFSDWLKYFDGVANGGATGNCNTYWSNFNQWKVTPGFDNVPEAWYSLYYDYRVLLQQAATITMPIANVCGASATIGGDVSETDDKAILTFFNEATIWPNRIGQIISAAQALK